LKKKKRSNSLSTGILESCLISEHDRDIIHDGINPMTFFAEQSCLVS